MRTMQGCTWGRCGLPTRHGRDVHVMSGIKNRIKNGATLFMGEALGASKKAWASAGGALAWVCARGPLGAAA